MPEERRNRRYHFEEKIIAVIGAIAYLYFMNLQIPNKMRIVFFLLLLLSLMSPGNGYAALPRYKSIPFVSSSPDTVNVESPSAAVTKPSAMQHLSFLKKVKLLRAAYRNRSYKQRNENNAFGIVSLVAAGLSIATIVYAAIVPALISALFFVWLGTALLSVIFGAIGMGKDKRWWLGMTGLIIGCVELAIAVVIYFLILIIIGLV